MTEPFRQREEKLMYGPYSEIPPFKLQSLSVHFAQDALFATVMSHHLFRSTLLDGCDDLGDPSGKGSAGLTLGQYLCRRKLRNRTAAAICALMIHCSVHVSGEYRGEVERRLVTSRLCKQPGTSRCCHPGIGPAVSHVLLT